MIGTSMEFKLIIPLSEGRILCLSTHGIMYRGEFDSYGHLVLTRVPVTFK